MARLLHTMLLFEQPRKIDFASAHASFGFWTHYLPQEIRDQIMDPNSDFQKRIVEYLESVHIWCQSLKHHYLCAKILSTFKW